MFLCQLGGSEIPGEQIRFSQVCLWRCFWWEKHMNQQIKLNTAATSMSSSGWVGIAQMTEGLNEIRRKRKGEFSLLELKYLFLLPMCSIDLWGVFRPKPEFTTIPLASLPLKPVARAPGFILNAWIILLLFRCLYLSHGRDHVTISWADSHNSLFLSPSLPSVYVCSYVHACMCTHTCVQCGPHRPVFSSVAVYPTSLYQGLWQHLELILVSYSG